MKVRDSIDLLILGAVWGASFLFMRIAGPEFGPLVLVQLRVTIGTLFLLPILLHQADMTELLGNWRRLTVLGVINSALPFTLLTYSTLYITGGLAGILNATAPIFTAVIAWLWLSDRMSRGRTVGLVVGAAGVYVLVRDDISLSLGDAQLAILAALLASFFYGLGGNFTKRHMQHITPLAIATGSQLASAVVLLPGAALFWPAEPVSIKAWIAVIVMGIFSTGFAYILYFRLIANTGPTNAITVTYLVPVFAMALGALFINEEVTLTMLIGCAIILLGTALATGMLNLSRWSSRA